MLVFQNSVFLVFQNSVCHYTKMQNSGNSKFCCFINKVSLLVYNYKVYYSYVHVNNNVPLKSPSQIDSAVAYFADTIMEALYNSTPLTKPQKKRKRTSQTP